MKFLRDALDKVKPNFDKGGKWEKWHYVYEAHETLLFKPNQTTGPKGAHIRDGADMKRTMMTVIIALIPCLLFGIWNAGYQHYLAVGKPDAALMDIILLGSKLVLPIVIVSYASGLGMEFIFATVRRHEVNEGFLVSGMLIPLVMPVTVPLWMVALGTVFAVVFGKEVFGGTGMNVLNPALTARAFLFFAYPAALSGDVWTYLGEKGTVLVDNYSGATAMSLAASTIDSKISVIEAVEKFWNPELFSFKNMFLGIEPGSIGETSTLMCLIGAALLIATGVGSWRIMVSMAAGGLFMGYVFNMAAVNPYMNLDPVYHLVMGGFAFGAVFMATDPVSASQTDTGKYVYGFFCGVLAIIIRVFNPAYPEGVMLAVLLMNVFAPLIDYFVINQNKKRRLNRATV